MTSQNRGTMFPNWAEPQLERQDAVEKNLEMPIAIFVML